MQKTLITAAVLSGAIILTVCRAQNGYDFQPNRPQRPDAAEPGASQNTPGSATNPAQQPQKTITITVPVVETRTFEESTKDGVQQRPRQVIIYVSREVPMPSAEETQRMREELRELNGQKIDLLDPVELIGSISRTKLDVAELQAWAKLVQIQAELAELSQAHEGTKAAQIAGELLGRIPAQRTSLAPFVRPMPDDTGDASPGDAPRAIPDVDFFDPPLQDQ